MNTNFGISLTNIGFYLTTTNFGISLTNIGFYLTTTASIALFIKLLPLIHKYLVLVQLTHLTRAFNSIEWVLNSPPKPHAFASLPLQSNLFKFLTNKINLNCFTFSLLISQVISVGMCLGYKLPIRFMLGELDLLVFYPFFNVIITLCAIAMISYLNGNRLEFTKLYMKIFFVFFVPFLVWYVSGIYHELYPTLLALFIAVHDIRTTMTMGGYNGSRNCYKIISEGSTGGGSAGVGRSSGVGSTGGGSAGQASTSRPQASSSGGGSAGQASTSIPQASSSGDDSTVSPARIQEVIRNLPAELPDLLFNPKLLLQVMDLEEFSAFNRLSTLPNSVKTDIDQEAQALSPTIQPIHPDIPKKNKESILEYWRYKIAYDKAIKQLKIIDLLQEKGHITSISDRAIAQHHKDTFYAIKNTSLYRMRDLYDKDLKCKGKKFVRRHMDNFVKGDTESDVD